MSFESDFGRIIAVPEYPELVNQGFSPDQILQLRVAKTLISATAERNALLLPSDVERINKRPDLQAVFRNDVTTGNENTILWAESRFYPDTTTMTESDVAIEESADLARSSLVLWDHVKLDGVDLTDPNEVLSMQTVEDIASRGLIRSTMLGYRDRFRKFIDIDEAESADWQAPFVYIDVNGFGRGKRKSNCAVINVSNINHGRTFIKQAIKETKPFTGVALEAEEFFDRVARFNNAKFEIRDGFATAEM